MMLKLGKLYRVSADDFLLGWKGEETSWGFEITVTKQIDVGNILFFAKKKEMKDNGRVIYAFLDQDGDKVYFYGWICEFLEEIREEKWT